MFNIFGQKKYLSKLKSIIKKMEPTNNKSMQYIILIKKVLKYMHVVQNSYSNGFHKDKTFKHIQ